MRLLSRYVLSTFIRLLGLTIGAFSGLYLLVEVFEKLDDLIEAGAAPLAAMAFFACRLPGIGVQILPLAVLLAVFLTLGSLSRTSELTAMRAAGQSLWRISLPLVLAGTVLSLGVLAAQDSLLPPAAQSARQLWEVQIKKAPGAASMRSRDLWLRDDRWMLHLGLIDPDAQTIYGIEAFELDAAAKPVQRLAAAKATFRDGAWHLEQATQLQFDEGAAHPLPAPATLPLTLTPDAFRQRQQATQELTLRELAQLLGLYRQEGRPPQRLAVDLQLRLAGSFAPLVMAVLGIPFALQRGRQSTLASGLALSVGVGVGFLILSAVLTAHGYAGQLPPAVAAWSVNLLFLALGAWMLLTRHE